MPSARWITSTFATVWDRTTLTPSSDTLRPGDIVIVIGPGGTLRMLRRAAAVVPDTTPSGAARQAASARCSSVGGQPSTR
jgi:hypothetical protein